ncbi:S49 family peptidase [Flectobacillus major]|uniref:S49 family peptidase n=1 Tax=Flectobacillus major TaxID=103 RepID=UPI00131F2DA1|nr:S49 family peptidase [Flectobacillus major]
MAEIFHEHIWNVAESHIGITMHKLQTTAAPTFFETLPNAKLHEAFKTKLISTDTARYLNNYYTNLYSASSDILVLPIVGEMSRYSYWSLGMEELAKLLDVARADDKYKGAVLKISTPGGTADGCSMLADAVTNFRKSKPVVTSTNRCLSAGYFIASQGDEIVVEDSAMSSVGSISSLFIYENYSRQLQMQGVDVEMIRAQGGENKAKINPYEPLTEETRGYLQAQTNAARKEFVGYVKRGRVGKIKSEDVFSGNVYGAKDAITLGLADRIGDFNSAIKRCQQLAHA